jgi:NAD+ synthetase
MAVGYCTLYGDTNGGLAAIADVPKTRVYSLCQWLNQGQPGAAAFATLTVQGDEIVPEHVLTKPPSAELRPGQLDCDSLPPYDVLDDILDRLIRQKQSLEDLVGVGHDRAIVQRVMQLLTRAEFKRRQTPPGLKVTERAFGTGWRMPIASRWQLSDI